MPRAPPDLRFLLEAEALKRTVRAGWARIGVPGPESVADHSWRLAIMAMLYAEMQGLDPGKAAQIAVLHDLAEARTGDRIPGEWTARQKHAREARALRGMLKPLPPRVRARWMRLWMEYEKGASAEARLVHELDKLEMVAQGLAYERQAENELSARDFDPFWVSAERAVASPALRQRFSSLRLARPTAARPVKKRRPRS